MLVAESQHWPQSDRPIAASADLNAVLPGEADKLVSHTGRREVPRYQCTQRLTAKVLHICRLLEDRFKRWRKLLAHFFCVLDQIMLLNLTNKRSGLKGSDGISL